MWSKAYRFEGIPIPLHSLHNAIRTVTLTALGPFVVVAAAVCRRVQVTSGTLVVSEGVDKLIFVHLGTPLDADLLGALLQILL
jgi:hypothetical protein